MRDEKPNGRPLPAGGLYRPTDLATLTGDEVARFYSNYLVEVESVPFSRAEREFLDDPKMLGRVVDPATRSFFAYHVGASIARVVSSLPTDQNRPVLLDLGCGSGSVALLLALAGANVIGIDHSELAVAVCRRRQSHYESVFGPLALEFRQADAVTFHYSTLPPCDGIYSVFAINMMQPTDRLFQRMLPTLAPGGRLALTDGNTQAILSRVRGHAGPTPQDMQAILRSHGLNVHDLHLAGLIPASLTRVAATRRLAESVERVTPNPLLGWAAASYTLTAEKPFLPAGRRRHPPRRPAPARGDTPVRTGPGGTKQPLRHPGRGTPHAPRRTGARRSRLSNRRAKWGLSAALGAASASTAACVLANVCLIGVCC